jgi:NAD(P)-dependent dehydrogenase (short-subunit alcohol dehydrogenase family)
MTTRFQSLAVPFDKQLRRLEYGSRGARINAVAHSLSSGEATADLAKSEAPMAAFRERLPIGRAATPDDIAGATELPQARCARRQAETSCH